MRLDAILLDVDGVLRERRPLAEYLWRCLHLTVDTFSQLTEGVHQDCFVGEAD